MRKVSTVRLAQTLQLPQLWLGLALAAACTGCAAPLPRGELPTGTWSGEGTFVYESGAKNIGLLGDAHGGSMRGGKAPGGGAPAKSGDRIERKYPTTLSIRPSSFGDKSGFAMEIRSQRGKVGELLTDDETLIRIALLKGKKASDSTVLFYAAEMPEPGKAAEFDLSKPAQASLMSVGDAIVFKIQYAQDFTDTFRFERDHVNKTGSYADQKNGVVRWNETLKRSAGG